MQYNNIIADSSKDNSRINAYTWSQNYSEYVTIPRTVSLLSATIPINFLSFKKNQLTVYMYVYGTIYPIVIQNGYYDDINEFLPILQTATNTALANTDFSWSYSNVHQCLKLSSSGTINFKILNYNYNPATNIIKRLGFISPLDYQCFLENNISVVYAEGVLQLARTSGFYIVSNLIRNANTANPYNSMNILDYVPINTSNLSYGDVISVINSASNQNKANLTNNQMIDANSQFQFQILDDNFESIDDVDRGGKVILMMQCDYD